MTELKSLKNPTRLLTILMFLATYICYLGVDGLAKTLPGVSPTVIAGIVSIATYAVTQYGTEKRIVRAEELKDEEFVQELEESSADEEELVEDGI